MKKLAYIDALRGYAILGVLMVHTAQYGSFNVPGILQSFIGQGKKGVQLFFIASAFTLFLSFSKRSKQENTPVRNFFIRRFFRIAPMYYLGVCYYLFQDGLGPRYWLGDATHISTLNIISNFTFLHGFNPYWITSIVPGGWSIAVEMTFYLLVPFLFLRVRNLNQAFNFFLISIFIRAILTTLLNKFISIPSVDLWDNYLFFYFPSQLPIFALGILMYFFVYKEGNSMDKLYPKLFIVGFLLFIQFATGTNYLFPEHIFFGFAFLIIGIAISKYHPVFIVNPIIDYIGKISFSMYLIHFAILHWLTHFNHIDYLQNGILNYSLRYIIVLVLTVIVASITYNIIEIPFQKFGKQIIARTGKNGEV